MSECLFDPECLDTWQGIPLTPAVSDWMVSRGYSVGSRSSKYEDCLTILGPELCQQLEAAAARQDEIKYRSAHGIDYSALIVRDRDGATGAPAAEPRVNPTSLLLENENYQQALQLLEPLFAVGLENIISSQHDPDQIIAEAGRIAAMAAPLKDQGTAAQALVEAGNLAKARMLATSRAINEQELTRALTALLAYLVATHFPASATSDAVAVARIVRGDDDGPEAFQDLKDKMLMMIEPSVRALPEAAAPRLKRLMRVALEGALDTKSTGQAAPGESEMVNRNLTPADIKGKTGADGLTPGIAALVRATTVDAVRPQAPRAVAPSAPAPVNRSGPAPRALQPAALQPGGLTAENLAATVREVMLPIYANIQAIHDANNGSTSPKRGVKMEVRSFQTGDSKFYGTRQTGFTVRSLVRASLGMDLNGPPQIKTRMNAHDIVARSREVAERFDPMQEEMARAAAYRNYMAQEPNFSVFKSKYVPSSSFSTASARDAYDESIVQPMGVAAPGVVLL